MTDIEKADRIVAACLLYAEAEIDATELLVIIEHIMQHGTVVLGDCRKCGHEHGHKDNCSQR